MSKRSTLQGGIAAAAIAAGLAMGAMAPAPALADTIGDLYGSTYDRMSVIEQDAPDDESQWADEDSASADQAYDDAAIGESDIMLLSDSADSVSPRAMSGEMLYFCTWESGQNYAQELSSGDGYHAMGYFQFDNRYDLGAFLKAVYSYNPTKYSALKQIGDVYGWNVYGSSGSTNYRKGSRAYTLREDLNWSWRKAYQADPTEFSQLQNDWAYTHYYVTAANYMSQIGIPIDNRSDSVKSLCWGMCNLFGSTGWRKFVGGYSDGYDWNGKWNDWKKWPGCGLTASMTDEQFVTKLCDYVVNNVSVFYKAQPEYWAGWKNRYKDEKAHYLKTLGGGWQISSVTVSATKVAIGTEITYKAKTSGTVSGTVAYNYVWQRDGSWAKGEWDSTVNSTGKKTADTTGSLTPTKAGTYTLYVDVTDGNGVTHTGSTKVTVIDDWDVTGVKAPEKVLVGSSVSFSAIASGTIDGATYNYVWQRNGSWSDGEWDSTVNSTGKTTSATSGSLTPARTGAYTLYVGVTDSVGRKKEASATLTVLPDWDATGIEAASVAKVGAPLEYSAVISGGPLDGATYNYVWQRDGSWAKGQWDSTVNSTGKMTSATGGSLTPTQTGTYTLYVDVKDSTGKSRTVSKTVVVNETGWEASVSASQATAYVGERVTISPKVAGTISGATYNYVWQRDGSWAKGQWDSTVNSTGKMTDATSYVFTPTQAGTYTVYVDVKDSSGMSKTVSTKVVVGNAWTATGVNAPDVVKKRQKVTFSAALSGTPTGGAYNYVWQRNGSWAKGQWDSTVNSTGKTTSATSGSLTPTQTGTYTLYVDVVDFLGKKATVSKTVVVNETGWEASVSASQATAYVGERVTISPKVAGTISGATYNYVWQRDGSWAKGQWDSTVNSTGKMTDATSYVFTPTQAGTYTVYVDVKDSSGKSQTVSTTVVVKQWVATGVNTPATARIGQAVTFSAVVSGRVGNATYNYVWQRNGSWKAGQWGSTVNSTGRKTSEISGSFTPTQAGTYTLYVDVTDSLGNTQTVSAKVTVS